MAVLKSEKKTEVYNKSVVRDFSRFVKFVLGAPLGFFFNVVPQVFLLDCVVSAISIIVKSNNYQHQFSTKGDSEFLGALPGGNLTLHSLKNEGSVLKALHLQNLPQWLGGSLLVIGGLYWSIGAIFYYVYDVKQEDNENKWKIQPEKTSAPDMGWIWDVWQNAVGSALAIGLVSCYVYNEGPRSKVYFNFSDFPLWWNILQWPLMFLYQDYVSYWQHRFMHTPFMYKHFHIHHHKYSPQRMLISLAGHPLDMIPPLLINFIPMFFIPVHWVTIALLFFNSAHTFLVDHSGVTMKTKWFMPWKHDVNYHDYHHRFANSNFGIFTPFWDIVYGTAKLDTIRQKDIRILGNLFEYEGKVK